MQTNSQASEHNHVGAMATAAALNWSLESVCLCLTDLDVARIAAQVYHLTCRCDFATPGFCVVTVETAVDSVSFRRLLVALKNAMNGIHEAKTGSSLVYLSASRFDQKLSTKPHLDGGPDECILMLGYEPSNVKSKIDISDYAKCAYDLGITPKAFMLRHNPMFREGFEILRPYTVQIPCFPSNKYQLLCINNSLAAYSEEQPRWQGVLHTATIQASAQSGQRIINSTLVASAPPGSHDVVSQAELSAFITRACSPR
jgi:hypothetical protein